MKINKYIATASILIFIVFFLYFLKFYVILDYKTSNDSAVWGQLGDYIGGILNPLLSFVSIVLLIQSLTLQNEANISLRSELKNSEKTEKLRSFETLFFNLINSQKNLFDTFQIEVNRDDKLVIFTGVKAVITIEENIEAIRVNGGEAQEIVAYLDSIDDSDQIFCLTRAFYIMVLVITERLSTSEGFSSEDRRAHFMTLINFTDFAQLRLIMMCVQFMSYESSKYIRSSIEFKEIIEEVGLVFELY
ncbi:hypothetical protein [Aeromonas salmonicida]|uniref:hypothetical protein n=1 Tax=Aeromonas salmonicida TaxID=645 RepID=UPI0031FDBF45